MAYNAHNKGKGRGIAWIHENVNYSGDDCLIYPLKRMVTGYAIFGHEGNHYYAHRYMCELAHGAPPSPHHQAAHSCGNGHLGCANPKHLSWKTKAENAMDCRRHGTSVRSPHGRKGRLKKEEVRRIRELRGTKTQEAIAAMFGVSDTTVRDIFYRRSHRS